MTRFNSKLFYLKNLSDLDKDLIRHIHKDDYTLYVNKYILNNNIYKIEIRDIDCSTGKDKFLTYDIPKNKVKDIEELL